MNETILGYLINENSNTLLAVRKGKYVTVKIYKTSDKKYFAQKIIINDENAVINESISFISAEEAMELVDEFNDSNTEKN